MLPQLETVEGGGGLPPKGAAFELSAIAIGLVAAMTALAALPSWRVELGTFQGLMVVAFVFHALALVRLHRDRHVPHAAALVLVVAFAMRAAVFEVPPSLSDDVHRYLWEGRVVVAGEDPYRHAPDSEALKSLRDSRIHPHVNHPHLATIYPPLAMAQFALVAWLTPESQGLRGWKGWVVLNDLALCAVLAWWCRQRLGSALPALAYAWNPLVVVEYAGQGHHDPTALLWLVVAMAIADRRPTCSAVALAASVSIKLVPLLALPFLWRDWPARARAVAATSIAAGLALFAWLTRGADSGLLAYARGWRNNDALFTPLAALFGDRGARMLVVLGLAAVVGWSLWRRVSTTQGTRRSLQAMLLLGPVLHPWYLGFALVWEPLQRSWGWWLLSATALLNYGVMRAPTEGGAFHLPLRWRVLEFGLPLLLALVLWALKRGRNR